MNFSDDDFNEAPVTLSSNCQIGKQKPVAFETPSLAREDGNKEEAVEDPFATGPDDGKQRKQRKPRQRFDVELLMSQKGFPRIVEQCKTFKFKGKGHERTNLKRLLTYIQVWAHNLKPDFSFRDVIQRTERLTREKRMKVFLQSCLAAEQEQLYGSMVLVNEKDSDEDEAVADAPNDHHPITQSQATQQELERPVVIETPARRRDPIELQPSMEEDDVPPEIARAQALAKLAELRRRRESSRRDESNEQ